MDLTEEDIQKRWREYTVRLYKQDLNDLDNHNSVITHLGSDILECEVKRTLGSITTNKASGNDGIPGCQPIWKTQQWPQDWKRSVFIPIPKKGNAKECSNSTALISHASKISSKFSKPGFNSM